MCEETILAQFRVSSLHLSRRAKASYTSRNQLYQPVVPRCDFEISRIQGKKMLPIRQQPHCVNCIAVPYTLLSAKVNRLLRYIAYLLAHPLPG